MKFVYKQITNVKQFSKNRRKISDIKFIVIHDTGNISKGANALAHYKYLQNATRFGSAHYFVDDKGIIQTIGDTYTAWGVGDNQGFGRYLNGCNNSNSISIEMCVNSDGDRNLMLKNTIELAKNLMKKFNISINNVVRHYDVSRKSCPNSFKSNDWKKWKEFKEEISKPIIYKIDLSKNSEFGIDNGGRDIVTEVTDVENLKEQDKERQLYLEKVNRLEPWAKEAWEWAVKEEITDGTYPNREATRQEVITILYRLENK